MESQRIAIEFDHVTKMFRRRGQDTAAVSDLSMRITSGEILGLLGPNGAGKTTAIKMLCGLVTPTSGTVRLNGYDVHRQRGQALHHVGAVLEGARNVYWRLTAWQNVLYFGRLRSVTGKRLKVRAEQLLRELGLWERRADRLRSFSRGM